MTEFMQDKIGNIYDGTISGVTEWGIYVEIEPTKVEGMVMLREIKEDFFIFDDKKYCIVGKSTGKVFTLGDKVKIKVTKANLEQKLIDYSLIWDETWNTNSKRSSRSRSLARDNRKPNYFEGKSKTKPNKGEQKDRGNKGERRSKR